VPQEIIHYKVLERYLNKVKLNGIRIGSLIAQYYALNYISKEHSKSIFTNMLVFLKYCFTLLNNKETKPHKADFIFTKLNNRFHFNALLDPLINHYNNKSVILCDENSFGKNEFEIQNIKKKSITFTQTNSNSNKDARKILIAVFTVTNLLFRNRKRLHLTFHEIIYFVNNLLIQLRRTSFWDHYFTAAQTNPLAVVTEFDRCAESTPLILAAKKHKIQTVTLIHGVLEDYSFTPFLADHIFCWGKSQKSQLISIGIDPKRIFITGNPMFADKKQENNLENHIHNDLCICLAISPGFDNRSLIEPFASALNLAENVRGILKLHPSLKKDDFKWVELISSKIEILTSQEIQNSDLFIELDLIIINDSGVANEALAAGVPVTVMIPNTNPQLNTFQNELIQIAGCQLVTCELALVRLFSDIAANPIQFKSNATKKSEKYLKMLYDTTGKDSVNAMISQIDKISQG